MQPKQKQNQQIKKLNEPYENLNQFLNRYKALGKSFQLNRIKTSKLSRFVQDINGYYYGEMTGRGRNGLGVNFDYNGNAYEGQWRDNLKSGQGFARGPTGWFYQGQFSNGKFQGRGVIQYINGDNYNGQWLNGEKSGSGHWKNLRGQSYIGEWKNNQMQGYGVMTQPNGDKYEGIFKKSKKWGKGMTKYLNGDIHKGFYEDNEPNGFGQYFWKNGDCYRGEFKKGKRQGPGEFKHRGKNQKSYQGFYKDNMKWGYGICSWSSGSCYKGFFQKDLRHGYGQMFWPDGNIYRGWWKDGVQNGKGQLFIEEQGLMKGIFNNNILVLLTQKKMISRKQYQQTIADKLPFGLPQGIPQSSLSKTKLSKSRSKQKQQIKCKSKSRQKVNKYKTNCEIEKRKKIYYTPKYAPSKQRTKSQNFNSIEFPLLFHHHSRMKAQKGVRNQTSLREPEKMLMRNSNYLTLQIDGQRQRQKVLHSISAIHKNYVQSNKNTDSTGPGMENDFHALTFWNQKNSTSMKFQRPKKSVF